MPKKPAKTAFRGGHYASAPSAIMNAINVSIASIGGFTGRISRIESACGDAGRLQKIISAKDGADIAKGLDAVLREIESGKFQFSAALEDVHMNIEARLKELIGEAAGRLHTARSRNDQVATDCACGCARRCERLDIALKGLQKALLGQAETARLDADAGLYPSAARAADYLRPPSSSLCRDDRARPFAPYG